MWLYVCVEIIKEKIQACNCKEPSPTLGILKHKANMLFINIFIVSYAAPSPSALVFYQSLAMSKAHSNCRWLVLSSSRNLETAL